MRRRARRLVLAAVTLTVSALGFRCLAQPAPVEASAGEAGPSNADEPTRAFDQACEFQLEYQVPPGCIDREQFRRHVHARVRAKSPAEEKASAQDVGTCRSVVVRVEISPDGQHGRVELRDSVGHEVVRDVSGNDCGEVTEAVALIVGLSLSGPEPGEASPNDSPGAAPPASEGLLPPAIPPIVEAPIRPLMERPTRPRPKLRPVPPRQVSPKPPAAASSAQPSGQLPSLQWALGVRLLELTTVAPDPVGGLGVFLGLSVPTQNLLAPRLRLVASRTQSEVVDTPVGSGSLQLSSVGFEACPVRWPAHASWALRPCASSEVGLLEAAGEEVSGVPISEQVVWGAASASGAAELVLLEHMGVEAQFGLVLPWIRDRFLLPPSEEVHAVPAAGWFAALNLSVFPFGA